MGKSQSIARRCTNLVITRMGARTAAAHCWVIEARSAAFERDIGLDAVDRLLLQRFLAITSAYLSSLVDAMHGWSDAMDEQAKLESTSRLAVRWTRSWIASTDPPRMRVVSILADARDQVLFVKRVFARLGMKDGAVVGALHSAATRIQASLLLFGVEPTLRGSSVERVRAASEREQLELVVSECREALGGHGRWPDQGDALSMS